MTPKTTVGRHTISNKQFQFKRIIHIHLIELVSARLGLTTITISPSFDGNLIIVQMRGTYGPTDRLEGDPSYQELGGGCFGHQRIGTWLLVRIKLGAKEANPGVE